MQIVKQQYQRGFHWSNGTHKLLDHHSKTMMCFRNSQRRQSGLRTQYMSKLGHQIDNYLPISPDTFFQSMLPTFQGLGLQSQKSLRHLAEGFQKCSVGRVFLQGIEFSLEALHAFGYQGTRGFGRQGGLSHPGTSGHELEPSLPLPHALGRCHQFVEGILTPEKLIRKFQGLF